MRDYLIQNIVKQLREDLHAIRETLQKHTQAINEATEAAKQDQDKTPEVRAILNIPESEQARKKASDAQQERYHNRNLLIGWLTLFSLIAYAVVTCLIYLATDKAAKAAQDAAEGARNTFEIHERAWVDVTNMTLKDNVEVGKTLIVKMAMENTGNSPAIHVEATSRVHALCGAIPQNPFADAPTDASQPSTFVLMPHKQVESPEFGADKSPLTEIQIQTLQSGGCNLYFFVRITYSDVFKHNHWRHVCGDWDKGTSKIFSACPTYNDGDEDYKDGKEP